MKLKTAGCFIFLSLLFFGPCCKKSPSPQVDSVKLVNRAFRENKIDVDTYISLKVKSIFAPSKLPQKYQSKIQIKKNYELDTLYMEIKVYWKKLKETTRNQLRSMFLRPTDPNNTIIVDDLEIEFGYDENADVQAYDTAHFRIHYVLSGEDAVDSEDGNLFQDNDGNLIPDGIPDYVNMIGQYFETAYDYEINKLGYKIPPSDINHPDNGGNGKIDVYIKRLVYGEIPNEYYFDGVSVPESDDDNPLCLNVSTYGYIMILNDFVVTGAPEEEHLSIAQITSAHELMHVVMLGYTDCWEDWLAESIAMWVEDEVFDDSNNYLWWTPYANDESLDSQIDCTWPWSRYLAERFGDDAVKAVIENYQLNQGLIKTNQVLQNYKSDFIKAYVDFSARNYTKIRRYGLSMVLGEPYEEGNTFETHGGFITIYNEQNPANSYPLGPKITTLDNLSSKYLKFSPAPSEANSPSGKRTLGVILMEPNRNDCAGMIIMETEDHRMIDVPMTIDSSGQMSALISGFGGDVDNKVDIASFILMLTNASLNTDYVNFKFRAKYLSGPDPQITPWGWSWGYKNPFFKSSDIQIQDTQGRQIVNPEMGRMNTIVARIRNLGDQEAENVTIEFYYAPFGIGVWNYKLIGSKTINLTVGGAQAVPIEWDLTDLNETNNGAWTHPIKDFDHFCLRVEVKHPDDINPSNNITRHNFALKRPVPIPGGQSAAINAKLLLCNPFDSVEEVQIFIDPSYFIEAASARPRIKKPFTIKLNPMERKYLNLDIPFPFFQGPNAYYGETRTANIYMKIRGEFIGGISYEIHY